VTQDRRDLDALVRRARTDGPTPDELARLEPTLGTASGREPPPDAPARGPTSLGSSGLAVVVVVGAVVIGGWLAWPSPPTAPAVARGGAPPPVTQPSPPAAEVTFPTAQEPVERVPPPAPIPSSTTLPATPTAPPRARVPSEVELLEQAREALDHSPRRALHSVEQHRLHYCDGVLAEEREVLAIDGLLRLGRRDAAEARAARFRVTYPGSIHSARIDALLGTGGVVRTIEH
jgi:hypothetical protein